MLSLFDRFLETPIPMVEIFHSISGEGVSAGNVVSFVRVAGCDLRCTWCDTKYSFKESGEGVSKLTPQEIIDELTKIGTKEIICTGGEPLEHDKVKRLLPAFIQSKGFKVRIETSGGSRLYSEEELAAFDLKIDTRPVYTMDVKCPESGMAEHNILENILLLDKRDELKFVVAGKSDFNFALEVINCYKEHLATNEIVLNFSPVFNAISPEGLVELLKNNARMAQENNLLIRLSLQVHKFIWPPHQRGV